MADALNETAPRSKGKLNVREPGPHLDPEEADFERPRGLSVGEAAVLSLLEDAS